MMLCGSRTHCNPFRGDVFGVMYCKRHPEQSAQAGHEAVGPIVQRIVDLALGRPHRSGQLNRPDTGRGRGRQPAFDTMHP